MKNITLRQLMKKTRFINGFQIKYYEKYCEKGCERDTSLSSEPDALNLVNDEYKSSEPKVFNFVSNEYKAGEKTALDTLSNTILNSFVICFDIASVSVVFEKNGYDTDVISIVVAKDFIEPIQAIVHFNEGKCKTEVIYNPSDKIWR